jgi:peptidoglycan/xylan/chitin deacetylase (PgdA/CDA1 family)
LKRKAIKSKTLVLTFDDGPGDRLTPVILGILSKYNVKATFFLLGRNIIGRENLVKQIAAEGHDIYSHGYDHINYWYVCPFRALADIRRGWQAIDTALGVNQRKYPFRPPYGKLNITCLLYLMIKRVPIVYWSIVSGDTWPSDRINSRKAGALTRQQGGGVVLIHDFDRSDDSLDRAVIEMIRSVLTVVRQINMQTKTISELLEM